MTLYRQLIIAVLGVLVLLYFGNFFVSFNNSKSLVAQQMQTHAQDAATSLAMSMTQATEGKDIATLNTMLNAVSDSGYYKRIYFVDMNGDILLEREFPVLIDGVPQWFVNLMELPDYDGSAEVASGWVILGKLVVVSHPGQAYKSLWEALLQHLVWFSLIGGGACVAAFFAVRILLVPLRAVESQANSICEQHFVQQAKLPKTRELRVVVEAMNRLSARLEGLFHSQSELISDLRYQSHTDIVTGLSNRTDFDARLNAFTSDETGSHCGALMIFALHDLSRINDIAGRRGGNDVLQALGQKLNQGIQNYDRALLARRQGQEFAVFLPDIEQEEAESLAASIMLNVAGVSWQHQEQLPLAVTMGFTYTTDIKNGPELLSEADMALHSIDLDGGETWRKFSDLGLASIPTVSHSVLDGKEFVAQAISERAIELHFQKTVSVPDKQIIAYEVYSRFRTPDDYELSASTVIPMVQRFGCSTALDKLALETLAETSLPGDQILSVNLCPESISDASFCNWLPDFLSSNRDVASRLVIEIPEHALKVAEENIRSLADILARFNSGLAIDHFGMESSAFGYLASMPLRYLKVHRSFVKNIHLSKDNQFYIKALAQLAQMREIQIVVEGVETEAEWLVLSSMNINAAQGFFLGYPEALQKGS